MQTDEELAHIKRIARTHYAASHDTTLAMADVAPDVIWHGPANSPQTYAGWKARHERLVAAFGEMEFTVNSQIAEGDMVVTLWTLKAVHKGTFIGMAPAGKRIVLTGIGIDRVKGDKVVEHWGMQDLMGLAGQIGSTPVPEGARLA